MRPKSSPLKILDFAITDFDFKLVPDTKNEDRIVVEYFDEYDLDIDFNMFEGKILHVKIMVDINKDKSLPGFSLSASVSCFFDLVEDNITDEQKNAIEGFSTIYIALNSLRGLISNFTANAPFGRYILPSIDLNDLIEQKKQDFSSQKQNTLKSKK